MENFFASSGSQGRFCFCGTNRLIEPGWLPAGERDALANAVLKRRLEYSTGRWCSRRALQGIGGPSVPIPAGPNREPVWPAGYSGSISHTSSYACALVAEGSASIGVDVERIDPDCEPGIWPLVMNRDEADHCGLPSQKTLVFSAKETLFKALFPSVGRYFDFRAAEFRSDWNGAFELEVIESLSGKVGCGSRFCGYYAELPGMVISCLLLASPIEGYRPGRIYRSPANVETMLRDLERAHRAEAARKEMHVH